LSVYICINNNMKRRPREERKKAIMIFLPSDIDTKYKKMQNARTKRGEL